MQQEPRIVYLTDRNFIYLTEISLRSLMSNANPHRAYRVALLHDNLPPYLLAIMRRSVGEFPNFSLDCVNLREHSFPRSNSDIYPDALFARFALPQILLDDESILYLDGDTIVLDDISILLDFDLEGAYLAACVDQPMAWLLDSDSTISLHYHGMTFRQYFSEVVGLGREDLLRYLNLGVSIWNLNRLRKDGMVDRFRERCQGTRFLQPSQDTIYPLVKDAVTILPARWNYMPFRQGPYPEHVATEREAAGADPALIHFARGNRPWERMGVELEEYFWMHAARSPFGPMIQNRFTMLQATGLYAELEKSTRQADTLANLVLNLSREVKQLRAGAGNKS